ncbi:hypothetical protein [Methanolacinia paynteri]|uniref:hypothetical protein n=1 Tax=Methanolacinia paynteri TaxID=230356 RepID=UPI00064F5F8D|nr:hypothetical protein [Methanolacinia paynteri]
MSEEIRKSLATLFPGGGVVELRALGDHNVHSGYFDDHETLAEKAETVSRISDVQGVYVTLNEINPALLSRRANRVKMILGRRDGTTADTDIIRRRWLPVDLDPVRPSGVSSTDEEHEAALSKAEKIAGFLQTLGFPSPILADSGNGGHLLYAVDLPNDEESTDLVRDCLTTLDLLFSDNTVTVDTANFNAARIWKLYGTISRKGDDTPDRPHRMARIIDAPDDTETVATENLQKLANLLPKDEPKISSKSEDKKIDLSEWLPDHGIAVASEKPWQGGTLFVLEECPFSSAHKDGAFAIQFSNGAIYAGCHHNSCGGGKQRWSELRAMYEIKSARKERRAGRQNENTGKTERTVRRGGSSFSEKTREKAAEILKNGDPVKFILDTFSKFHVGDETLAECLVMSIASQSVENTNGLHVFVSGDSGKGKSVACRAMTNLVPEEYRLRGKVSDKALYYNRDLVPETVFLFDDAHISEDVCEILKSATTNFRERIEYQTLTTDRQLRTYDIPERCVWWVAKVESIGDDQVLNRMLTVWIDDTSDQDKRVLDNLKRSESREKITLREPVETDICRCIWAILKEETTYVSIPFAERVQFSSFANRRNPAIFFDLVKCHALLFKEQRERFTPVDEDDNPIENLPAIRAMVDDFDAAARIYAAINGDSGSQETKLTKNEAAALEVICKMGWDVVTVKMLQDVMGISYHQARRIFHGYLSRGCSYSGLLEKCPAIGFIDATVSEEADGVMLRQRESRYSFNYEIYREWDSGNIVWLDKEEAGTGGDGTGPDDGGGPDDDGGPDGDAAPGSEPDCICSFAANLQPVCSSVLQSKREDESGSFTGCSQDDGSLLPANSSLRKNSGAQEDDRKEKYSSCCVCTPGSAANMDQKRPDILEIEKACDYNYSLLCGDVLQTTANFRKAANVRGSTLPLPGVLDHRDFERVNKDLGKCDLCSEGKAVFSSRELKMSVCEGCFGRLLREDLEKEGVR